MNIKLLVALITFVFMINISAQLVLPSIFSDNMVLQRGMKIPVWGKSAPFAKITVVFNDEKKIVSADDGGNWMAFLSPISANCNPQKMSIESDGSKITFTNVLVGEVWLCSGQSNMKSPLKQVNEAEKYIAKANNPKIRFNSFKEDKRSEKKLYIYKPLRQETRETKFFNDKSYLIVLKTSKMLYHYIVYYDIIFKNR